MKTHAKTMRKALSLVLTIAILMSAFAVMLSTFTSAYTAYGPSVNTYTWDFTTGKGIANWAGDYPSKDAEFTSEGFRYYQRASGSTSAQLGTPDATFIDGDSEDGASPFILKENAKYSLQLKWIIKAGTAVVFTSDEKTFNHNPYITFYNGIQTKYEEAVNKQSLGSSIYDIDALYKDNPDKFTESSHEGGIIDPAGDTDKKFEFDLYKLKEDIEVNSTFTFNTSDPKFYKGENFRDNFFFTISAGTTCLIGNDDKSYGGNRGKAEDYVAMMDVVLVSATMVEDAAATYSEKADVETFVFNFIDDETGVSAYDYATAGTDYTNGRLVSADEKGLLFKTVGKYTVGNGSGTAASYDGFKIMDPDFGLGADSALKFEAGNDYGIVVKYKIANDAALRENFPAYFESTTEPYKILFGFDVQSATHPLQFGTSRLYGGGSIDKYQPAGTSESTFTNAIKLGDDGWRYFYYQFTGSNFDARESTSSDGRYFIMDFGYGGLVANLPTDDAQLLVESVTVTVKKCDANHTHTEDTYIPTGAIKTFNLTTYVDSNGKIVDMKYVHPSQTFGSTPDGKYDYYESDTYRTSPRGEYRPAGESILNYTVNVDTNKIPKTSIDVYDFTSDEAITAYTTFPYHYHVSNIKNGTGGGNGTSYIDENGLYFNSTTSGGPTGSYGWIHTFSIKGINGEFVNGANQTIDNGIYLRYLPGKKYRIEVEYDCDTNLGLNIGVNPAIDGADAVDNRYLVLQKWTSPVSSGLRTAVFELDSDQIFDMPVAEVTATSDDAYLFNNLKTLYGGRIRFSPSADGAITVKKVTVYTADKDVSTGDDVIADLGDGFEMLKAGAVLVDAPVVNGNASLGWKCDGVLTTTAKVGQFETYQPVYPINNTYDFSNGRKDLYMPARPNLPGPDDDAASGYEFVENADDGGALKLIGKTYVVASGSGSSVGFGLPSAPGLGDTSGIVLDYGKTYTLTFDVKLTELNSEQSGFSIYVAHDKGIGAESHKQSVKSNFGTTELSASYEDNSWKTVTTTFTLPTNPHTCTTSGCASEVLDSIYITLHYGAITPTGTRQVHIEALIDNVKIVCDTDELYTNVADDVKSSIRGESGSGDSYVSAGVRFRASVNDATIAAADEIGFIALPAAGASGKWYDMTALNANAKVAKVYVKDGAHTIYKDNDGYNDYQLIVSGLSKEGATNNGKALDIIAVLYIKTGNTYEYKFVRNSSYNEVKQMYIDSGIAGPEDY